MDDRKRVRQMKIGLVGLGRMGQAIFARLRQHGFELVAWDLDPAVGQELRSRGADAANSPAEVAARTEIVVSMISADDGARHNFHGAGGYLEAAIEGKLLIEMSTLQPMTVRALAAAAAARGAAFIEVPVLGSIPSVHDGKLLALAGGRAEDIERARPVLTPLTRRIVHMGPIGSGAAMKLAVNLGLAAYIEALSESLALGQQQGLARDVMLEILGEAPINNPWFRSKLEVFRGGEAEITLDLRTMRKDVLSALATGTLDGVPMPVSAGTLASLSAAVAGGWGEKDIAELPAYV
ncbi:MAG: NAD(P)-dependent oxidoreductase, partial [Acetobacteraceae bacterium]